MNIAFQTETTDVELIEKIKNGSTKEVQIAQFQFYKRYAGYIYKIALQGCSNFSEPQFFAKEVLQKTFIKVFEYIHNFKLKDGLDDNQINKIIKAWLGKISNKVFLNTIGDYQKEQIRFKFLEPENYLIEGSNDEIQESSQISNIFMQKLQLALNELNEKDRHILLTYADEYCIDNTQHLSDSAMDFLCSVHETNSANIRQRKKRALDKLKGNLFEEIK